MSRGYRSRLAAMLATTMLLGTFPAAAFADKAASSGTSSNEVTTSNMTEVVKITKEKAEELARKAVSIPREYALQSINLSMDFQFSGKRNVWRLEFTKKVNGNHQGSISIQLHADTGQLLYFNAYENNVSAKPSYPLKVDRTEAKEIALKFIAGAASAYSSQLAYNEDGDYALPPLSGEVRHYLRFDRVVDGVVFNDNYISVEVDSEGYLKSYRVVWDDKLQFPSIDGILSVEVGGAKLRELAKPILTYIVPYGSAGKQKPILSYSLAPVTIDAKSGEIIPDRNNDALSEKPLTDKPLGEVPKAGTITEQQAIDKVKASLKLPANAELNGSNYGEYDDESTGGKRIVWNFDWSWKKDGKDDGYAYAAVDGQTGAIQSFYMYSNQSEQSTSGSGISVDRAIELASAEVKKQLPWLSDQIYMRELDKTRYENKKPEEIGSYYIRFARKLHDAVIEYDNISVTVNARTGEVSGYDSYLANYEYEAKAPAVIDKAAAVTKWFDYYRVNLTYRLVDEYRLNGQTISLEKYKVLLAAGEIDEDTVLSEPKVELIYTMTERPMDERVYLNAVTGDWNNRETGVVTELERPQASDVDGHWAQASLELMVAYKALDLKDGKVRPNEQVTRGELIKMLVLARSGGYNHFDTRSASMKETASFADVAMESGYFAYVESALEQNLIDIGDGSFNPDGKVTRDDMAELIVRALGYNTLAKHESIFNSSFKDAAQIGNKGQVAIVVGLGIMTAADGKFQPDKQVTRADAATAFFRYLQARAELQEAPLRM